MKKKEIKIIKRNNAAAAKNVAVTVVVKTDEKVRLRHRAVVSQWIAERRENSRLERIFTDRHIVAWKALPGIG